MFKQCTVKNGSSKTLLGKMLYLEGKNKPLPEEMRDELAAAYIVCKSRYAKDD
jgi:hypothetical protein